MTGPDGEVPGTPGVTLVGLATVAGREKTVLLGAGLGVPLLALAVSLFVPDTYTARTLLLPPQQGQSAAASALATFGVLSAGLGAAAGVKSPEEIYVSFLKSESIAHALIAKFALKDRYGTHNLVDTRKALTEHVKITGERKTGLVTVEVDDLDPKMAADMANGYAKELLLLMNRIAVTEASLRRKFFDEQTQVAKASLGAAEMAYKAAQEKYGIQSIDVKAQGDLKASSDLRAQIMLREIQIQAMRDYAGPDNPDLKRAASEVASLRAQLIKVEQGGGSDGATSEAAMANQRAYREVKYQEAVLAGLITQAEYARADEARQAPLVQQVDVAVVPDKKSKPKRTLVVLVSGALGVLLGILIAWRRQSARNEAADAEGRAERLRALREAWRWGRR